MYKNNEKLTIIWKITDEMNGFFLDYFEPIDNIIFLQENNGLKVDYKGCYMAKGYEPDYSQLKLKPYLQKKLLNTKIHLIINIFLFILEEQIIFN